MVIRTRDDGELENKVGTRDVVASHTSTVQLVTTVFVPLNMNAPGPIAASIIHTFSSNNEAEWYLSFAFLDSQNQLHSNCRRT